MKIYINTILILLIAFTFDAKSQPKIEIVGGYSYNWGDVLIENTPLFVDIQIKNVGNEDLKIFDLVTDCGCTTAPLSKNLIAPGDTGVVNVRQFVSHTGQMEKRLTFKTNDPNNQTIVYSLLANVTAGSTITDKVIDFKDIHLNKEVSASIVIENAKDYDVRILKIKCTNPDIKLNIKDGGMFAKKSPTTVQATLLPQKPGPLGGKITIYTNDPEMGKININIAGNILDKF